MQSTQPPDQLEPKGWWCWLFLTLMTSTNQSFDSVYFTLILCWILPCSSLLMNMHPPPKPLHEHTYIYPQLQFSSSVVSDTLCDPMDCSTPGFPAHHQLPELAQIHVHWVGDAIQPSHPLSSTLFLPSIFPSIRVCSNMKSHIKKLEIITSNNF